MKYRVADIFQSIRGEAIAQGEESVFIRFAGCNLNCPYCDTNFTDYEEYTLQDVLEELERYPGEYVCLTGGEPTLQDIRGIILQSNKTFDIETNYTQIKAIRELEDIPNVRYIVCSPKYPLKEILTNKKIHYKFVPRLNGFYDIGVDIEKLLEAGISHSHIWVQPLEINGEFVGLQEVIEIAKKHKVMVSIQNHKLIGVK